MGGNVVSLFRAPASARARRADAGTLRRLVVREAEIAVAAGAATTTPAPPPKKARTEAPPTVSPPAKCVPAAAA